ncbi:hypothetical protein SCHPADRAFT_891798 [Schizopora paradoxa]|uniref:Uncharacterized protein n=1 Tax=Schizopora paradoxa TaxID=27342 RepID=A0A0H2RH02_9AGAM|nr:hypothetical protein SCHPADRAFT_891798 [Schizopora paradoxa]
MPSITTNDESKEELGLLPEISSAIVKQEVEGNPFKIYDYVEEERKKKMKSRKRRPAQQKGCLVQKLKDFPSMPRLIRKHDQRTTPFNNDDFDGVSTQFHSLLTEAPITQTYVPAAVGAGLPALGEQTQVTTAFIADNAGHSTNFFCAAPQSPEGTTRSAPQVSWSQFGGGEQQSFGQGFSLSQAAPDEASFLSGGDDDRPLLVNTNVTPTSLNITRAGADKSEIFSPISPSSTTDSTSSFGARLDSNPFYDSRNPLQHPHDWHWQLPQLRTETLSCGCVLVSDSLTDRWIGLIPALSNHENSSSYSSPQTPLSGSLGAMAMYSPQALSPDAEISWSNVAGPSTRRDEN